MATPWARSRGEWLSWDHIHVNGVRQISRGLSRRRLAEIGLYFFGTSDLR